MALHCDRASAKIVFENCVHDRDKDYGLIQYDGALLEVFVSMNYTCEEQFIE